MEGLNVISSKVSTVQTFQFSTKDKQPFDLDRMSKLNLYLFYYTGSKERPESNLLACFDFKDYETNGNELTLTIDPSKFTHTREGRVAFCIMGTGELGPQKWFVSKHENGQPFICN